MSERIARLRLSRAEGLGPAVMRELIARAGTAEAAVEDLPRLARGRAVSLPPTEAIAREEKALAAIGAQLILDTDDLYPEALSMTADAPLALAVAGDPALLSRPAVAIVGARNASAAGRLIAERLARDLADLGFAIVSGLARGVDAAAHEGALAEGGVTIAAVAGGLDRPYPPQNAALQARIAAEGAVVAEAPLGTAAMARLFPRRNRIVAGLSLGTVVVEAALKSGSLITARLALEAGRDVFAVPASPLDPRARGSNDLLRQGATLVETVEDILAVLPSVPAAPTRGPDRPHRLPAPKAKNETQEQKETPSPDGDDTAQARLILVTLLSPAPVSVDEVVRRCPSSAAAVNAALVELDLEGRLEWLPGNRVALREG